MGTQAVKICRKQSAEHLKTGEEMMVTAPLDKQLKGVLAKLRAEK